MVGLPLLRKGWLVRFGWLIPISVAIAVYYVALNNYFTFDDFIWLNRARTLKQDWSQIFRVDVAYFDPLVHLIFWVDYQVAGLNHSWYHCVDLAIHATNSLLVYRFARLLNGDKRAAIYIGILFASSFAIADAVLWSSSRVDLLATLCALGTLIQFLNYLRHEKRINFLFSFLLFVLALGAKGTPLILPLILLWLIVQERKPFRFAICLAPFGAVILLYVIFVKLSMHQASLPLEKLHFSIHNFALAFCALFIPDETLSHLNLDFTAPFLFLAVTFLALFTIKPNKTVLLRRTGYCILLVAILPVLILTDFKLATKNVDLYLLLRSPSHRLYLASVGVALLSGGFLRSIEMVLRNLFPRFATVAVISLITGVVTCNTYLVRERDKLWESVGDISRIAFQGLVAYQQTVGEGSQLGLIYFPSSRGFLTPLVKMCFGVNDVSILKEVDIGQMTADSKILQKAHNSFLFILDNDGHVYDKSQLFRRQLLLNKMVLLHPDNPHYTNRYQAISDRLNQEIMLISPPEVKIRG